MSAPLLTEVNWLVDFGALLDLRLGALFTIDPNAVIAVLDNGWHDRTRDTIVDDIGGVSVDLLKKTLKDKPMECAKNALPTFIPQYIAQRIKEAQQEEVVATEFNKHHITVNVYPLNLTEEERRDLVDIVMELIPVIYSVEIISVSPYFVTPLFLKGKHAYYITYDFFDWIKIYDLQLNATPIPEVTVIAPKLMEQDPDTYYGEDKPEYTEDINPWSMFGLAWAPFINVHFEDIKWFSAVSPKLPT